MEKKDQTDYIDLLALCSRYIRHIKVFWPAILLVSFMLTGMLGAVALQPPEVTYTSLVVFSYGIKTDSSLVYNYTLSGPGGSANADTLSNAMIVMMDSSRFKEKLKEKLDTESLNTTLSLSFAVSTNLGTLKSESTDEKEAVTALTAALEILPDIVLPVLGSIEIHIQDEPEPVQKKVTGLPMGLLAGGGFVIGLFLGLGFLGLITFFRHELISETDIKNSLSMKVFGSLPYLKTKFSVPFLRKRKSDQTQSSPKKNTADLIETTYFKEQVRLIATQISKELKEKNCHSLLIMSTKPAEGKTVFAKALNRELLKGNRNVKLVQDLDTFETLTAEISDDTIILFDIPATTSDLMTMKASDIADASLLVIKSNAVLAKDVRWGLHFLNNGHAKCIGTVLNACV